VSPATDRVRARIRQVMTVSVVAASLALVAHGARAAEPAKPLDPSAATAAIELHRTAAEFAQLTQRLGDAEIAVGTSQASLNVTVGELTVNQAQLDVVVSRVRARGVEAYQNSGASTVAPRHVQRVQDLRAARQSASWWRHAASRGRVRAASVRAA